MTRDLRAYEDRPTLMQAAADTLAEALQSALDARGEACVALSGGSTPEPAYALLAGRDLDWARIKIALVDERFVPPDHEASNERMLRRALAPAIAHGAHLLPMYAPAPDMRDAAERANALYAPLTIDLALMGMGEDGHTASWFPGAAALSAALDVNNPRTVIAIHAPQAAGAAERLTLTFSALCRAARVALLITGSAKRSVLEHAREPSLAPVAALDRLPAGPPLVLWAE
jgi:6-phosphogluconolactonase